MVCPSMILCADIGGTHTKLALIRPDPVIDTVSLETHASADVADLGRLMADFLARSGVGVDAACLGIAGPVIGTTVQTTNLPWRIDATVLSAALGGVPVFLLNDLEALAYAIPTLGDAAVLALNPGVRVEHGTVAIIAAGTGLGEAGLVWNGRRWLALASEGGHADFAPRSEREIALLRHLLGRWEHVSWERVVSGPGLVHIFEFLRDGEGQPVPAELAAAMATGDPAGAIAAAALGGTAPIATAALDLSVLLYGAEAGNLALKLKAMGGLYVGGGIAPKIAPKLRDGTFREAFLAKGRFRALLEQIPVRVVLDDHAALSGSARYAADQVSSGGRTPANDASKSRS